MDQHNKAADPHGLPDGHRRMAVYLADNLRGYRNLAEYVYQTQFVQGQARRYAYRDFRRRFGGPGKNAVSGALEWQIIDAAGIAKPAYYTIRRELAALTVGVARVSDGLEVWLCSADRATRRATQNLWAYTLDGRLVSEQRRDVQASPGRTTPIDTWPVASPDGELVYFAALTLEGEVVSRASNFPEPYRYHDHSDTELRAEVLASTLLRLSATRPTKGVWLDAETRTEWSDNFLDLRPREPRTVTFSPPRGFTSQCGRSILRR